MDEENGIVQGSEAPQQDGAQDSPVDLEAAFKYLNAQNKNVAQGDMGAGAQPEPQAGREQQPEPEPDRGAAQPAREPEPAGQAAGDAGAMAGGERDSYDAGNAAPSDYSAEVGQLDQFIINQAQQIAAKEARDQGVRELRLMDLREIDERTGVVTWKNLENPSRPFQTRDEAERWLASYNNELNQTYKQRAMDFAKQLYEQYKPTRELLQFAPEFDKMSKVEQEIFDDLVEPYGITDSNGDLIGYSCNLRAAKSQAVKIAKRIQENAPAAEQSNVKQPSVRMPKGGSSGSQSAPATEPKTIQEAMKMYHDQIRKERK